MDTATTSCFNATSITENTLTDALTIYPNPAQNVVSINFELQTLEDVNINIINSLGQQVHTSTFNNHIGTLYQEVDLSSFPEGLYFVKIITGGESITERIAHIK